MDLNSIFLTMSKTNFVTFNNVASESYPLRLGGLFGVQQVHHQRLKVLWASLGDSVKSGHEQVFCRIFV